MMISCPELASYNGGDTINNKIACEDQEEDVVMQDNRTNTITVIKKIPKWISKFLKNHSWILGHIGFSDSDG